MPGKIKQLEDLYGVGTTKKETKTDDVKVFDFKGGYDTQKYLLETGLQNIFNLYNQKIGSLDAEKQKEIEDAYYIRELSKKYLGEYASNLGIGDVSGDLLNIYGNYQQNINAINQHFAELAFGYETEFQKQKMDYEYKLADVQAQISEEERMNKIAEIKHNLTTENYPDNMSRAEYIESIRTTIGEQEYWALKAGISEEERMNKIAEIKHNLTTENYPDNMSRAEYIESIRTTIGEQEYWALKTEEELIASNQKLSELLGNMDSYDTQEEWDAHIDAQLRKGEINESQSKKLKNLYAMEQHTSFELDSSFADGNDISYLNPKNLDLAENPKIFRSKNKQHTLVETNNVIYPTDEEMYNKLDAEWQGGEDEYPKGFNKPFPYGDLIFVRNNDGTFTEYVAAKNQTQVTGITEYSKDSEKKEIREEYERIHNELKGKTGHIGYRAYEYDEETGNYKLYLDFTATDVGGEKGTFNIGGADYKITKNYKNNGDGGIADIKDAWENGDWKNGYKQKHNEKDVVEEMIRVYFGGDREAASKYIEESRSWGKNTIGNKNAIVVYMPEENAFYTINDGELWELKRI
jgi:hypothetical protein